MNEFRAGLPGSDLVTRVYAEQDDFQLRVSTLEQPAGLGGGGSVKSPVQQQQVRRPICQGADQRLHAIYFYNPICPQFASKQKSESLACG